MAFDTDVRAALAGRAGTSIRNSTLLWLGDAASALLAALLAGVVAYALSDNVARGLDSPDQIELFLRRLVHYAVFVAGVMVWLAVQGHYSRRIPWATEVKQILIAIAFAGLLDGFSQYAFKAQFSRLWLGINWVVLACMLVAVRHTVKSALIAAGSWQVPTLMVGNGPVARAAEDALASERLLGYAVVGRVDLTPDMDDPRAATNRLWQAYRSSGARFVVMAPEAEEIPRSNPLLGELTGRRVPFAIIPSIGGMSVLGLRSDYFFSHDVVLLTGQDNLAEPLTRGMKRAIDIAGSAALLLLLGPFLLATLAYLRLQGAPAFVAHRRVGMGGKPFSLLKFRTWQPGRAGGGDPFLRFLRHSSLDELPQLINVLRGEMSLVGPRPIVETEQGLYGEQIGNYLAVRPGITGIWQVSGREDTSYTRRVQLDAWYVRNWSLWHDVTIIAKTLRLLVGNSAGG
ncbi:hypothetical protein HHL28_01455 [Aerophototrophica crusticola]|uniref:Bacterial sugar transferase domain-containing protein n=1 Tax=Aerophototrophica crusticola TaxID=1709002 RepID=A0A858R3G9_9PROT|nr:hypothetical protein HHL28_01455 [Rhodospirillaceae bacterium B3]